MAVQILISQTAAPATQPGEAREDLVTGLPVALEAIGGPYSEYLWSFVYKAIDIDAGVQSSCAFDSPDGVLTLVDPVDKPGTYMVQVTVNSGQGLGATEGDVARITFYAGEVGNPVGGPLNADPAELPRRIMAFREQLQHNVPDAIETTGNMQGWSREWLRWFSAMQRMYEGKSWARGLVTGDATTPVLERGFNVAGLVHTATGIVEVTMTRALADEKYSPVAGLIGTKGFIYCEITSSTVFSVYTFNSAGTAADLDFAFDVGLGADLS